MLAVIETHPVQYHAPVYRAVQETYGIPVTAIYGSDFSVSGYRDAEFGASFKWDGDLTEGYGSRFLSRTSTGGATDAPSVSTKGLRSALRSIAPSAALVVGYSPRFHQVAWLEAYRTGAPVLFRGETSDHAVDRGVLRRSVRDAALSAVYRRCARLLFIGRHSRDHFRRLGVPEDRLVASPYCVDTTPFDLGADARDRHRSAGRAEIGAAPGDLVLLFSGKLSVRKGVDLLVQAVRRLPADLRGRTVVAFLGDGEERRRLAEAAAVAPSVRTVFLGFRNQRELSRYYHTADLLVLPSRFSETWGLVVNEALHHGVPCVVSARVGSAPDLIEDGVTGWVCPDPVSENLGATIERALALVGAESTRRACQARVSAYTVPCAAKGIAAAYLAATGHGADATTGRR